MTLATTIDAMVGAGCTAEQVAAVVRVHSAADEQKKADRRTKDADRKRRQRLLSAEVTRTSADSAGQGGTPQDRPPSLLPSPTPLTNNSSPQSSLRSDSVRAREAFAELREAYPRRQGANPWEPAEKKFLALVRGGTDPAEIIAGAKSYAASVAGADPRYTAQAITWLNQARWRDDHTAPPPARAGPFNGAPPKRNTAFAVYERLSLEDEPTSENPAPPLSAVR